LQLLHNYELMHNAASVVYETHLHGDVNQQIFELHTFRYNNTYQFLKSLLMFISLPI